MPSDTALPSAPAGSTTRETLYRAALGPAADHYLPVFARFDERGTNGPAWNTAAALGHLGWLVYRQLWGAAGEFAAALAVWALLAAGLVLWADVLPMGVRVGLALALLILLMLVPGLYGTALLHAQVVRRMIAAVRQAKTMEEACILLRQNGAVHRRRSAWGLSGLLLVALVVGAAWMAWPPQAALLPGASSPMPVTTDGTRAGTTPPNTVATTKAPIEASTTATAVVPASVSLSTTPGEPVPVPVPVSLPKPVAVFESGFVATPAETPKAPIVETVTPGHATPPPAPATERAVARVAPSVKPHGVSVGLFAVPENADRIQTQLRAAGLPVLKEPIESASGRLTRVRVGPFERRDQAQAAAERVRALGLEARVYAP